MKGEVTQFISRLHLAYGSEFELKQIDYVTEEITRDISSFTLKEDKEND